MGLEIERKFLVNHALWRKDFWVITSGIDYRQGYLVTDADKTVRVRIAGPNAWLTIKGKTQGATRLEYEYPIPVKDATEMLNHFAVSEVFKTRHVIDHDGKWWEVDIFKGNNEGLIIAELELQHEDEPFTLPSWVEREVTGEEKYYNSRLSEHPFKQWQQP